MAIKITQKRIKVFSAGALLTALAATSVTSLLSIGAAATAVDLTVSLVGGLIAISQT